MYQRASIDSGGGGSANIAFGSIRYITATSSSYTVDIFEDDELVENTFNYSPADIVTENNHIRVNYTGTHKFTISSLNGWYLYVMTSGGTATPYVQELGQNGSIELKTSSNPNNLFVASKDPMTITPP